MHMRLEAAAGGLACIVTWSRAAPESSVRPIESGGLEPGTAAANRPISAAPARRDSNYGTAYGFVGMFYAANRLVASVAIGDFGCART